MMNWQLCIDGKGLWDKALLTSVDYSVFQAYGWGEFKKDLGWLPKRYWCVDNAGEIKGMAQLLIKRLPFGMFIIWAPGGIVLNFGNFCPKDLKRLTLDLITKVRSDYPRSSIRFNFTGENNPDLSFNLNQVCSRPYFYLNSGYSVNLKVNQPLSIIKKNMSSKHRYYVNLSSKENIDWYLSNENDNLAMLINIHNQMINEKNLTLKNVSFDQLRRMRDHLGDNFLVLTGLFDGVPISSCLVLLFGKKAFYMMASTNNKGRELSASYAMFARLIQELNNKNIVDFDFGGIDPKSKSAVGVNYFKCGFGGKLVEYLGEWESASSVKIKVAMNVAMQIKSKYL